MRAPSLQRALHRGRSAVQYLPWLVCLAAAPAEAAPGLSRTEPSLAAGAAHLEAQQVDEAIEAFRKAQARSADERAAVEYDVGSALLARALRAPGSAQGSNGAASGGADPTALAEARAAFSRALGLAKDPKIRSEAALAAGNSAALARELDDAVSLYRQAIVADPGNARAKSNLRLVLEAKRQEPPPPSDSDSKGDQPPEDKEQKEGEQDPGKQRGEEQADSQKEGGAQDDAPGQEPPQGGDKAGDKGAGKEQSQEPQGAGDEDSAERNAQPQPKEAPAEGADGAGAPKPAAPAQGERQDDQRTRAEARRLLDALRGREKPLAPMEMRAMPAPRPSRSGKEW